MVPPGIAIFLAVITARAWSAPHRESPTLYAILNWGAACCAPTRLGFATREWRPAARFACEFLRVELFFGWLRGLRNGALPGQPYRRGRELCQRRGLANQRWW